MLNLNKYLEVSFKVHGAIRCAMHDSSVGLTFRSKSVLNSAIR